MTGRFRRGGLAAAAVFALLVFTATAAVPQETATAIVTKATERSTLVRNGLSQAAGDVDIDVSGLKIFEGMPFHVSFCDDSGRSVPIDGSEAPTIKLSDGSPVVVAVAPADAIARPCGTSSGGLDTVGFNLGPGVTSLVMSGIHLIADKTTTIGDITAVACWGRTCGVPTVQCSGPFGCADATVVEALPDLQIGPVTTSVAPDGKSAAVQVKIVNLGNALASQSTLTLSIAGPSGPVLASQAVVALDPGKDATTDPVTVNAPDSGNVVDLVATLSPREGETQASDRGKSSNFEVHFSKTGVVAAPPDLQISQLSVVTALDGESAAVRVGVINRGGTSAKPASITLSLTDVSGVTTVPIGSLQSGQVETTDPSVVRAPQGRTGTFVLIAEVVPAAGETDASLDGKTARADVVFSKSSVPAVPDLQISGMSVITARNGKSATVRIDVINRGGATAAPASIQLVLKGVPGVTTVPVGGLKAGRVETTDARVVRKPDGKTGTFVLVAKLLPNDPQASRAGKTAQVDVVFSKPPWYLDWRLLAFVSALALVGSLGALAVIRKTTPIPTPPIRVDTRIKPSPPQWTHHVHRSGGPPEVDVRARATYATVAAPTSTPEVTHDHDR